MAIGFCLNIRLEKRRIFGRRKFARRTEPKGDIKVKKSPQIISSKEEKKRKVESHSSRNNNLKKSRISEYYDYSLRVDGYEDLGAISKGSFGVVYKVRDEKSGEILAVKEELDGLCPTTLMEIDLLKSLGHHPSIVGFKKVVLAEEYDGVYVVMEYMEFDLKRYVAFKKEGLGITEVKRLMKQLLEGVKFLHENGVMHRDLKPANILVNKEGELKICDFGLSTRLDSDSSCVGTLCYRAPEQLFRVEKMRWGAQDMWAVGCIMAELVLKKVLFVGESESDQFLQISKILGSPDEDQPCHLLLKECESADLKLQQDGFDLLKRFFTYDPIQRITAEEALNHVWFQELS